ncbi:PIN domain-containing protein [Streptomyces sp. NPDC055287]
MTALVLDSQGLSAWITDDRFATALIDSAHRSETDLVISANTIIEVTHAKTDLARLSWLLSRIKVEPVTEHTAKAAARLLKDAGLHGHKYAIDATVAEAALRQSGPVTILTSDVDDMTKLCGGRVRLIAV